jgi:hypothetical protein
MDRTKIIEIDGTFVAVFKREYDEEGEMTILGVGKSKEECLEMALEHAVSIGMSVLESIQPIEEAIEAYRKFEWLGQYVMVEGVEIEANGEIHKELDGVFFDEESKKWHWCLR